MQNHFEINIINASNGNFTVYITGRIVSNGQMKNVNLEFCGSMPEVGDYIRTVVTQQ